MMETDTSRSVVRRIVEAFETGRVEAVASFVHDEYVDHQGLIGEEIRGLDGFKRVVAAARSGFEHLHVLVEDEVVDDEKVVVRLKWHGTRSGGEVEMRETIDVLHLQEGRMIAHWGAPIRP